MSEDKEQSEKEIKAHKKLMDESLESVRKARASLSKARFQIITDKRLTFFGVCVMNLRLIPCHGIMSEDGKSIMPLSTAATDGRHLFFNPEFINKLTTPQVKGVFCHEVGHVTGFHFERQMGRERQRWNIATDIKINSGLRDIKIELPKEAIYGDYSHQRMTAEEVYNTLPKSQQKKGGGGGEGDDEGGCGIVVSPRNEQGEKLSPSEARKAQYEQRGVVEEASRMAKAQGSMPQFVERLINEVYNKPLPWEELLRRFVLNHVKRDYTWRRPNRRMIGQDLYLPSQKTEGVGEVVVAIDTSGSISSETLSKFIKEIQSIMDDAQPDRIHVLSCDAQVHNAKTYEKGDTIDFKPVGGGGTAFAPPFQWVEEQGIIPLCLVYLTDLCGSFGSEPQFPVIWAATQDGNVPWGEKILLNND